MNERYVFVLKTWGGHPDDAPRIEVVANGLFEAMTIVQAVVSNVKGWEPL